MKNITIVRGKTQKNQNEENPCHTALQTSVLEVKVENIERTLEEHKKFSEKHFDLLEKKLDNKFDKFEASVEKQFNELKNDFRVHEEKLEDVEEKINQLKNSFTVLVTKFGILFSFLCSLGVMGLNFVMDKFK